MQVRELGRRLAVGVVLGPLVLGASALSCDGPHVSGAVGLVEQGDRVGVVVTDVDGYGGLYSGGEVDRVLEGDVAVVWTSHGRVFSAPESIDMAVGGQTDGVPSSAARLLPPELVSTWAPCLDASCTEVARWSVDDERWDGPVGRWRTRLLGGPAGLCHDGAGEGVVATAVLPGTGELVAAMGEDGIAVRATDGGWDRRAVAGWEPAPLTLADGLGVLRRVPLDAAPLVASASLALWLLAMASWRRRRASRPGLVARPWMLAVPLVLSLPVAMYAGLIGFFTLGAAGVLAAVGAALGLGAIVSSVVAHRGVEAAARRADRRVAGAGLLLGLALVAAWSLGVPGPALPWLVVGNLAPLVLATRQLIGPGSDGRGTSLGQEDGATASN